MAKQIVISLFIVSLLFGPLSVTKVLEGLADSLNSTLPRMGLHNTGKNQAIYGLVRATTSYDQETVINPADEVVKISGKLNYTNELYRTNYIKCLLHYYSKRFTKAIRFAEKNNQIAGLQSIYKIEKK